MKPKCIRVIAICAIWSERGILVFEGFDSIKGTFYYRPLGGGVEPGETSEEAVAREIQEEVGLEITALRLLGVMENRFDLQGEPFHEVVFVYEGSFRDERARQRDEFTVEEDNGQTLRAVWRDLNSFDNNHRLVPEGLSALLQGPVR
jgi:8-oxo-dGTP pyrophosphatase MutT (NUDIX family)